MNEKKINEQIVQSKKDKIRVYPCNNLRASSIGHPCERYLVLMIQKWEEMTPHDEVTQSIFDLGNSMEDYAIKTLREVKIDGKALEIITPTERSWRIDYPLITGREDCRIKEEDGNFYPVEIKGLSPFEWDKLNSVEDFLNSKKHYIRAYPSQLYCYMWKFEKEHGWFALVNKLTGQIKMINVPFDWEFADKLLAKGKRVYDHIKNGTLPEPIEEEGICEKCPMRLACGHVTRIPADVELDDELEELIDKKNALKGAKKEFEDLDEQIKKILNKRPKVLAGKYLCTYKCTITPAHIEEAKEIPTKESWRLTIKEIK